MGASLAEAPFSPDRELAEFAAGLRDEGAVVSFVGLARPTSAEGASVERLVLEHHPRLTLRSLEAVEEAARARFAVSAVRIVHRAGAVAPGDAIVFAAAAAVHRRAAFDAADFIMDRLKTGALFWKREEGPGGSRWIEPRDDDHEAANRWSETCPE